MAKRVLMVLTSHDIMGLSGLIQAETPVAMVRYAPAILRDTKKPQGEPLLKGRKVTGFSAAEDQDLDPARHHLFSLERMLIANGGEFIRSQANWNTNVVEDGALITGQNPASAAPIAQVLADRIG